jgi:hypothetical protein
MRDALAERLLAEMMGWTPEDVARERPSLQAMAAYKYDEYQQFYPGMRFVESLALWLRQFKAGEERRIAYDFIRKRLVFCSSAEIAHLVSMAYPDHIRPLLLQRAAHLAGIPEKYIIKVANSTEFRVLRRQSLFLGLSDGARMDLFRRCNPELSHEQIWQTYEISPERAENMIEELSLDLEQILRREPDRDGSVFKMVFLLDDFSGSGLSYLREDAQSGAFTGKIAKLFKRLTDPQSKVSRLVIPNDLHICIVLYMATDQARGHLERLLDVLFSGAIQGWSIEVVQQLTSEVSLHEGRDAEFLKLVDQHYDPSVENEHTEKGGTDVKRGFAGCALPVVLTHNTPNNSLFLLWANPEEGYKVRGLFPRISRHRGEP